MYKEKKMYSPITALLSSTLIMLFFLFSCNGQNAENIGNIAALQKIDPPKKHYQSLAKLPDTAIEANEQLDQIHFPNKKYNWLIKFIASPYLNRNEKGLLANKLVQEHPANSSAQTRAELDFLLNIQENRTEEQMAEALRMHDIVYFPLPSMKKDKDLFFEAFEIFGSDFNPSDYPATKKLLHKIMKEMRIMEFTVKNRFLRARPRQLEPKLKPLKKMDTASFASGHTLWAYLQAYVMSELIPSKRTAFIDLAYEIGFSREILGVHYPSDEEAARNLAHQMLELIWEKPAFKKDFVYAQKEWRAD